MMKNVLASPLEGSDHTPFRLRDVPKSERLAELEFALRGNSACGWPP